MTHGVLGLGDFSIVQTKLVGQFFDSKLLLLEQDLVVVSPVSPKQWNLETGILLLVGALLDDLLGKGQPGRQSHTTGKSFAGGGLSLVVTREQGHGTSLGKAPDDNSVGGNPVILLEAGNLFFNLFNAAHQTGRIVLAAHSNGPIEEIEPSGHGHSPVDGDWNRWRRRKDVFDVFQVGLEAGETVLEAAPSPGSIPEAVEKDERPSVGCLGAHGRNELVVAFVVDADKE